MPYPGATLYPGPATFPAGFGIVSAVDGLSVVLGDLDLSGTDAFGVQWFTLSPLQGWDGSPGSSLQLAQKTRAPGAWVSPSNLTPRSIVLTGMVLAPDPDSLQDAIDRLNAAVTLDDTVLTITRGTKARGAIVRRQDDVLVTDVTDVVANWSVQVVAAEPRKFAATLSGSTALPSATGGLTIPFTVPFVIASTVVSGEVHLTNPGNATGPVVLRIDGPVTGPQVTHVSTGLQLTFGASLTLNAGEFLVVDMEAQTALANGQASRSNTITSRGWSGFDPGANTWAFAAVSGSGQLTVSGTPAWL